MYRAILLLNLVLITVTSLPTYARKPVGEAMANGATILASTKLAEDPASRAGLDLLRFALAVDPENRQALLLQAKVERGLELDAVSLADGGAKYCAFLAKIAERTKQKERKLLLYKVIELVQPNNEDVLFTLTKAANDGVDTSFDSLLKTLDATGKSASKDGPGAEEKVKQEGGAAKEVLQRVILARAYIRPSSPWQTINDLNRALCVEGVTIRLKASKLPYETSTTSYNGIQTPYYHGNTLIQPGGVRVEDLILTNRPAHAILRALCWVCKLGYTYDGSGVLITNPDDPSAVESGGVSVKASVLIEEFETQRADSIRKYRGKRMAITGPFSGIGKAMRNDYVHIAGDKVQLLMGDQAPTDELKKLEDASRTTPDDSFYTHTLMFGTVGVCDGLSRGKLVFKNCEDVWWWHARRRR